MNKTLLSVLVLSLIPFGCEKSAETPEPTPGVPPAQQVPEASAPVVPPYEPEYTFEFVTAEGAEAPTGVKWTALVNTGGWTMTTESVLVEPPQYGDGMNARVYIILEQPAPGETVTQAMETLTGTHDAAQPITHGEFSVKRKVRGDTSGFDGYYSVIKTIKVE